MKYKILISFILIAALAYVYYKNNELAEENNRLKANQEILATANKNLLTQCEKYKVADSLNAAKAEALQLKVSEYKRYRSEDFKLVKQLKLKASDLQAITAAQAITVDSLKAKLQSVIRVDTITQQIDTLKCFTHKSKWTAVEGCILKDTVTLQIQNTESLKIIQTVKYKRFLGFLWKTNKVKNRHITVLSENPNTQINGVEYINIEN